MKSAERVTGVKATMQRYCGGWFVEVSFPGPDGDEWLSTGCTTWRLTRWGARRWARRRMREHATGPTVETITP